ncbi:bifunctional 3-(3-hydroxy-phenyl)propionate/3-hydroxycinnamic acid hydroxylase [Pendulispora brunnea]|uniref:Bifunctional 3-(3-hydroxy-phenyl)propionate/3-hydroxycinnamic acid hydroxylase n=1 Tax=Pendulispora brunnea TaxID=2905690 RepID=A0ABZ2JXD8_9BACT
MNTDVVISGLGPTGLALAHLLGRRGHRVVVLEREPEFYGNARAVYTDDECMRIFQSADLATELQSNMLLETPCQWVGPRGEIMGQYFPTKRPFGWPVLNFFYQPYLETSLAEHLARYPQVIVHRGRELTGFSQDDEGVTVTHEGAGGDAHTIRARYLIGADGGRSTVRTLLGICMTGKNFPEPWLVVDIQSKGTGSEDGLRHLPYFNFHCDPACPAVSCPQPDGHHRFEFMLRPGQTKEEMEKPETVRRYLSRFVDPDQFEVKRRLVYTFNALVANRWRQGRVFLAGDAAHMTPQFMGQGMSSGLRDAYNLAWKLDAVLRGKAADALLDTYEAERRHHAKAMIDISVRMKQMVSASTPWGSAIRNAVAAIIRKTPPLRDWVRQGGFKPTPTYAPGYFGIARTRRGGPEGRLVPQPEVRRLDGRRVLLDHVLGEGFALVGLGVDPRAGLSGASCAFLDGLGASFVTLFGYGERPQGHCGVSRSTPAGLTEVEDLEGDMLRWCRKASMARGAILVIRPDKFLFGVGHGKNVDDVIGELRTRLGATPVPNAIPVRAGERYSPQHGETVRQH